MTSFFLHSDITFLFLELRKCFDIKPPLNAASLINLTEELVSKSLRLKRSEVSLLIPAFDYNAFNNPFHLHISTNTRFGLANMLLKESPYSEVIWDPVFRVIKTSGYKQNLNNFKIDPKSQYAPFTLPNQVLNEEDYIIFTPNSFQPTLLIEIEYAFFGEIHPYRTLKTFEFFIPELKHHIRYDYLVRPLSHEAMYNLDNLEKDLVTNNLLKALGDTSLMIVSFADLKKFVFKKFSTDIFYLLNKEKSASLIKLHRESGKSKLVF